MDTNRYAEGDYLTPGGDPARVRYERSNGMWVLTVDHDGTLVITRLDVTTWMSLRPRSITGVLPTIEAANDSTPARRTGR